MEDDDFVPTQIDIDAIASAKSLGDAMRLLAPQLEGLPRRSRGKYGKRKHLTPEERAELTRRRNRENARSTRMRRKMYIKHLQQVADTLKLRHDELNSKMTTLPPDGYTKQRESARRFFEMRGECVVNQGRWLEVVAPDFEMTVPTTPFDDFPDGGDLVGPSLRLVVGAGGLVTEGLSLRNMLADLADKRSRAAAAAAADDPDASHGDAAAPKLTFDIDPGSIVHVGDTYVCQWAAKISVVCDGSVVVSVSHLGMAKCTFAPDNRLATTTLRYDVLAFTHILAEFAEEPTLVATRQAFRDA